MLEPDVYLALAIFFLSMAAATAALALGDELILAAFNAAVNVISVALVTYVIQITRRLDKEVRHGGE